ncbi:MAG: tetratricopeptide repeat protein [Rubripirellula sp.]
MARLPSADANVAEASSALASTVPQGSELPADTAGKYLSHRSTVAILLLFAAITPYLSSLSNDFVWLDRTEIVDGGYRITNWQDAKSIWTSTLGQYLDRNEGTNDGRGGYWRPVLAVNLTIDWAIWRDRAWLYHAENIGWHLLCVICLYLLGLRVLKSTTELSTSSRVQVSLLAACLFAAHPLGVHSVTWISGRKDCLCTFFALVSILLLWPQGEVDQGGFLHREVKLRWAQRRDTIFGCFAFIIALGCKELAFVVPIMLAVLVCSRPRDESESIRLGLFRVGILLTAAMGMLAFRWILLGGIGLNASYPTDSPLLNAGTSARIWMHYVARVLVPLNPSISDHWNVSMQFGSAELLSCLGILTFASLALWGVAKKRAWGFAAAWMLIWMLPASGLLPLRHLKAERYLYPASWGLLMFTVIWLYQLTDKWKIPQVIPFASLLVAGGWLGLHTSDRNALWNSDVKLFRATVQQDPDFAEGHLALATIALSDRDYETAIQESSRAIEIGNDSSKASYWSPMLAHSYRGLGAYHLQDFESASQDFRECLRVAPNHAVAHYHMGLVLHAQGDTKSSIIHYAKSFALNPNDRLCRSNLAHLMLVANNPNATQQLLEPVVDLEPVDQVDLSNYATALLVGANYAEATRRFAQLNRQSPEDPITLSKLAWAQLKSGKREAGIKSLEQAKRIQPSHPTVLFVQQMYAAPDESTADESTPKVPRPVRYPKSTFSRN